MLVAARLGIFSKWIYRFAFHYLIISNDKNLSLVCLQNKCMRKQSDSPLVPAKHAPAGQFLMQLIRIWCSSESGVQRKSLFPDTAQANLILGAANPHLHIQNGTYSPIQLLEGSIPFALLHGKVGFLFLFFLLVQNDDTSCSKVSGLWTN